MTGALPLLLSLTLPITAVAEAWTWNQSVERARAFNLDAQAARADVRSRESDLKGDLENFYPQISASVEADRGNGSLGVTTSETSYTAALSGNLNLFNGFSDWGKWREAREALAVSRSALAVVEAKVSYDLSSSFQGLIYAREYLELARDIIRRRRDNLRLVEMRFASGRENKGSVLLSKAYLAQGQYEELQALHAFSIAAAALAKVLNLESAESLEVSGEVPILDPPELGAVPFQNLAVSTPDYLLALAQERSAENQLTLARSGFYPTLNLKGSTGRQGTTFLPDHEHDRWSLSLNLTLPLFNGGRDYYASQSAAQAWAAAMSHRGSVTKDLLVKIKSAYAAYSEAVMKLKVDESFRQAAVVRSEIGRKKYDNGLLNFENWDLIENDLINRQKTYIASRRDRVLAEGAWLQVLGKGVFP